LVIGFQLVVGGWLFPRSGLAIAIVVFGWGIQHIALPFVFAGSVKWYGYTHAYEIRKTCP